MEGHTHSELRHLLVQIDGHGRASPRSASSLHARRFLLAASFRIRTPPSSAILGEGASGRRCALGHGNFAQERCSRASSPGIECRAARREGKTKSMFAACSYSRQSRPHDFDLTAARCPRVDGISFTVHPERYLIYRPPLDSVRQGAIIVDGGPRRQAVTSSTAL